MNWMAPDSGALRSRLRYFFKLRGLFRIYPSTAYYSDFPHKIKKYPKLRLSALTFTTIQASQTTIHNNASFGITLLTKLRTFWEALFVHFFA